MYKSIPNQVESLSDKEKLQLIEFLASSLKNNITCVKDHDSNIESVTSSSEDIESEVLFTVPVSSDEDE